MSDKLIIFDTTLRDGEQSPGASMTKDEKVRIAKVLEKMLRHYPKTKYWSEMAGIYGRLNRTRDQMHAFDALYVMGALMNGINRVGNVLLVTQIIMD